MKSPSKGIYYWDSSIFLLILGKQIAMYGQETYDSALEIAHWMESGQAVIITSEIIKCEVLECKAKHQADYDRFLAWLQRKNMVVRGIDHGIAMRAARLRCDCVSRKVHCPKTPDAIHLATALSYEDVGVVNSLDRGFIRAASILGPNLKVERPNVPPPPPPAELPPPSPSSEQLALFAADPPRSDGGEDGAGTHASGNGNGAAGQAGLLIPTDGAALPAQE